MDINDDRGFMEIHEWICNADQGTRVSQGNFAGLFWYCLSTQYLYSRAIFWGGVSIPPIGMMINIDEG